MKIKVDDIVLSATVDHYPPFGAYIIRPEHDTYRVFTSGQLRTLAEAIRAMADHADARQREYELRRQEDMRRRDREDQDTGREETK